MDRYKDKKRGSGGRLAELSLPQHPCTPKKPGENEADCTCRDQDLLHCLAHSGNDSRYIRSASITNQQARAKPPKASSRISYRKTIFSIITRLRLLMGEKVLSKKVTSDTGRV